jgi:hypothetical protein
VGASQRNLQDTIVGISQTTNVTALFRRPIKMYIKCSINNDLLTPMLHGELCNDQPSLGQPVAAATALQEVFKPGHFLRLYSILTAVDGHRHNLTRQTNFKESRYPSHFKQPECTVLKTNPAIWFHKMCRSHHLTPKYINITNGGNNQQSTNTKRMATTYRTHQKLTFLYVTKHKLNEQLHQLRLQRARQWSST